MAENPTHQTTTDSVVTSTRDVVDAFHRTIVHYAYWLREVDGLLGAEESRAIEGEVWPMTLAIQMKRLAKILGFEVDEQGVPLALKDKTPEERQALLEGLSINWLANDGIWFQAVERRHDLPTAQTCNDRAWDRFSPFEATRIAELHDLSQEHPLDRLHVALQHRLYSNINRYTIRREAEKSLVLEMNDCRVQSARKRKGLEDYPCKSGGTIEYTTFAQAIDPSIKIECIGCPPDPHPDEWYCAWRFTV